MNYEEYKKNVSMDEWCDEDSETWEVYYVVSDDADSALYDEYDGVEIISTEDFDEAREVLEETLRSIREEGNDNWLGACCYNPWTGEEMYI